MSYIDLNYINLISPQLEKFSKKKDYLYNFRCPYCGDSQKNRNRCRGFFYRVKSEMLFKCHNCGQGRTLANFLKDNNVNLYDQYVLERFKNGLTGKGTVVKTPEIDFKTKTFNTNKSDLISIEELNRTHPARKYLESRQIPQEKLKEIFYVEKYKTWVNKQKPTFKTTNVDHPRIIIPLVHNDKWFGFQGRSLNPRSTLRYITTILDESIPKIYNIDKVDYTKKVYVTEGPIDSMFLKNSVAMVGADFDHSFFISKSDTKFVFVYDNEPRNKEIVERMQKVIDMNCDIVIWPKTITQKDVNDMVTAGHDVQSVVESNTFCDLEAKLKLTEWKRV
jgi:hypothetical protein